MSLYGRDTPPSIQDGPLGWEPDSASAFDKSIPNSDRTLDENTARKLARECYDSSTNWINSGRRASWTDALRAFQGLHPTGSKYLSNEYRSRSNLYRPKSRAMVRKSEAHTAAAFFANEDVVSIQPMDDNDQMQKASAELIGRLLQYRLTSSDPHVCIQWFLTVVGARQDTDVLGVAVAKAYWKYTERHSHTEDRLEINPETGESESTPHDVYKIIDDRPCVDLIAPENFRFEPGADWRDPVNTSPYLIENIPMYVSDVRLKMESGEWKTVPVSALRTSTDIEDNTTRRTREAGRLPGKDADAWKPRDYDVCWVHFNIIRWKDRDWCYYTIGSDGTLLSDPLPIEEVFLHGVRPYVVGFSVPETHKTFPSSKTMLVRDLQRATNDEMNLRFDSLKLSLQPRQFVRQGAGTELNDLRLFAPGKVVLLSNPKEDVVWDRPPDITPAAYEEQDRINLDFDELVGDFSNTSVAANQQEQQSATGMHLMSGIASSMAEYELHVFAVTFVEPLMRLLVKLEQAYETDPIVLAIAGKQAKLIQKFGIDTITDDLLQQSLTTRVNVGIGATNPQLRLKNFVQASQIIGQIFGPSAAMGANFQEVSKEVFGLLGYRDGSRFFMPEFDPRVAMLQQQLQKLQGKDGSGSNAQPDPYKLQAEQLKTQTQVQLAQLDMQNDERERQADLMRTKMTEQGETQRLMYQAQHDAMHERAMQHADHSVQNQQHAMDLQHQMHQHAADLHHEAASAHTQHRMRMHEQAVKPVVSPMRQAQSR